MQNKFFKILFTGSLLCCAAWSLPAKESSTALQIPRIRKAPVIDGKATDPCWQNLPFQSNFCKLGTKTPVKAQTRFKVCHDNWNLYVFVECDEPAMDKIRCATGTKQDDEMRWKDDSVEVNLVPLTDAVVYYKYIINTAGGIWDMHLKDDNTGTNNYTIDSSFSGNALIKTVKGKDRYTVECAIPLYTLDLKEAKDVWRFNIGRNRTGAGRNMQISLAPGNEYRIFNVMEFKW